MTIMRSVNSLVIGAGITGLAYGSRCKSEYLIVEKDLTPGGMCRTFYRDDYVWDYAGHFFHFKSTDMKKYFESRIPKEQMVICEKNTKIYYGGQYIDYPFQMNIHQLPKKDFIDCLYDLHFREQKDSFDSFENMLYGKFGKSITEKFLKPYNQKLYACDLNKLDVDAMGRFFPYASEDEIIQNMKGSGKSSYNDTFEYPKRGAQRFVDALLEDIPDDRLLLGVMVERVDLKEHIAYLSDGQAISYERLINTIPFDDFVRMADMPDEGLENLSANKVLVFNLGFDREPCQRDIHWVYYPEQEYCFYRVGFYNNILGADNMSLYVEIGYNTKVNIDIDMMLQRVIADLKQCKVIVDHKLCSWNYVEINPAYVHITKNSNEYIKKMFGFLNERNVYSIGRYGGWKYCSIEDCMLEAIALADSV